MVQCPRSKCLVTVLVEMFLLSFLLFLTGFTLHCSDINTPIDSAEKKLSKDGGDGSDESNEESVLELFEENDTNTEPQESLDQVETIEQITESEQTNEEGSSGCQHNPNRLYWRFQTPGPDDLIQLTFVQSVDDDEVPDIVAVADDERQRLISGERIWLFMISGKSEEEATLLWEKGLINSLGSQSPPFKVQQPECLSAISDLDGDGKQDLLVGTGWSNRTAFAVNGATGDTIWMFDTHDQPETGAIYSIRPFPDVTNDGLPEVVLGTGHFLDRAFFLDGKDGKTLWQYSLDPLEYFQSVGAISDLNLDGYPDVVLAGGGNEELLPESFSITVVSGNPTNAEGQVVYDQITSPLWPNKVVTGNINQGIALLSDINADGKQDFAVGVWGSKVLAFSGIDGEILWSYEFPGETMLVQLVNIGDQDDDGFDDVIVAKQGPVVALAGGLDREERLLWKGQETSDTWAVDRITDLDGDGTDEVISGSFDTLVRVYNGKTGTMLWDYDTGTEKIKAIAAVPDITGDGSADVVVGTQAQGKASDAGVVLLLEGGCLK